MYKPIINTMRYNPLKGLANALPILAILTLLLNGCAVKQPVQQPKYPQKPPVRTKPVKVPSPSYPPPPPRVPVPVPTQPEPVSKPPVSSYTPKMGAGGSLYSSAREAFGKGDYQQAEMALERALKIEPRNAHYWFTMAQVKYKQQQFTQTVHLCSKSKSLAGRNAQLLQLNDELSAKAQQRISSN